MHFLETPSGLKFVLNTSCEVGSCRKLLQALYDELYVEVAVKHPSYAPGELLGDAFGAAVNRFLSSQGLLGA